MDAKQSAGLYGLAYGKSEERRRKGIPGPLFDLAVIGAAVVFAAGYLG